MIYINSNCTPSYLKVKVAQSDPLWPHGLYSSWDSPGQNTGVGSLYLLQGIFPTQRWNLGLPHCRWILYQLSHKGSPRTLEWVTYPFSGGSSQPGIKPGSPALQVNSLPTELSGKYLFTPMNTLCRLKGHAQERWKSLRHCSFKKGSNTIKNGHRKWRSKW